MDTPHLDAALREIEKLKRENIILHAKYDQCYRELKQKQESWDKAANYRDEVLKLREEDSRMRAINRGLGEERYRLHKRVHELVKQCDEKSKRIEDLCKENSVLENRINERYSDCNYHMRALDRLCAFVKPKDMTSEGAVSAAINWINRLIEDHEQSQARFRELTEERDALLRWKNGAMVVDRQVASVDNYVRTHPEAVIGDDVWGLVGKWLVERDYLKRKLTEIKKLIP